MSKPAVIREMEHEARTAYNWASVAGAVARGELRPTTYERLLRLSSRYKAHKAAGRLRAAAACKEMAMRIVDSMEGK